MTGSDATGITPTSINAESQTDYGSSESVTPIRVGQEILFVQRTENKLRAMVYDFDTDGMVASDLTLLAEHIMTGGIVDMAYQQEPYSIIYAVRTDGTLLALAYDKASGIVGWSRYVLGDSALFKAVGVVKHPDGDRDQVWVAIKRGTDYYIEYFEDEGYYGNINVDNAFVYDGASISKVIGLGRFNSKTVNVVVDGVRQADVVVSGGVVDLSPAGQKIEIGLPFTATLKTLRPEIQTETGSNQGRRMRWAEIFIRLYKTIKLKVEGTAVDSLGSTEYTGDVRVANLGWDRNGNVTITHDEPLPCTILGLMGNLTYED